MQNASVMIKELEGNAILINEIRFLSGQLESGTADMLRNIAFQIRKYADNVVLAIGLATGDKANILVMVSDKLVKEKNLSAISIIKEISGEINGSGGGQPFLASAGGNNPSGITAALKKANEYLRNL
jgi:alanyl-tRNA synthetase